MQRGSTQTPQARARIAETQRLRFATLREAKDRLEHSRQRLILLLDTCATFVEERAESDSLAAFLTKAISDVVEDMQLQGMEAATLLGEQAAVDGPGEPTGNGAGRLAGRDTPVGVAPRTARSSERTTT